MDKEKNIYIVFYSKGGNTKMLAKRFLDIFREFIPQKVKLHMMEAHEWDIDTLIAADGLILGTPDYFSYPAGAIKTIFDELYPQRDRLKKKPVTLFVTHGGDGKAVKYLEKLVKSVELNQIGPTVSVKETSISSKDESLIQKNCMDLLKALK